MEIRKEKKKEGRGRKYKRKEAKTHSEKLEKGRKNSK